MTSPQELQALRETTASALGALLEMLGVPGGVLVLMQPGGQALVVAVLPDSSSVRASELLRAALDGALQIEADDAGA